jgi:hypothetical protein
MASLPVSLTDLQGLRLLHEFAILSDHQAKTAEMGSPCKPGVVVLFDVSLCQARIVTVICSAAPTWQPPIASCRPRGRGHSR